MFCGFYENEMYAYVSCDGRRALGRRGRGGRASVEGSVARARARVSASSRCRGVAVVTRARVAPGVRASFIRSFEQ